MPYDRQSNTGIPTYSSSQYSGGLNYQLNHHQYSNDGGFRQPDRQGSASSAGIQLTPIGASIPSTRFSPSTAFPISGPPRSIDSLNISTRHIDEIRRGSQNIPSAPTSPASAFPQTPYIGSHWPNISMTSGDAYPSTLSAGYRAPASFLPPPPSSYASPSALRLSTAQNIPKSAKNILKSFDPSRSAVASLGSFSGYPSDSHTLAQNQARRVEKVLTPVELSWQSVRVGHPVDACQLREEAMLASATPAATRIPESPAVPSAFLPQKMVPSVSNRGLDSLLNHHPSAHPPSTPGSTSLTPIAQLSPLQLPPAHPPLSQPSNPTPPARAVIGALLSRPSFNPVPPALTPTSTRPLPALPGNDCMVTASPSLQRAEVNSASWDMEGDGTTTLEPSPAIQSPGWVVRQGPNRATSGSIPAVHPIMGPGEWQLKARTKDTAFPEAVKALADHMDGEIRRIAAEFKKSLLTVKKVMGKAQELRLEGRRLGASLAERHKAIADAEEIQEILNNPDGDEAQDVLRELKEYQLAKFQGRRASAKANDNDIVKTWGAITHNAQNLSKRTSAATFGFVCSSKPGQNVSQQFFGNGPIEGFLTSKFGMTGSEFVEAAEAYFVTAQHNP
ncbi:hypothetical protein GGU10DRAFT_379935 [Lentinula aff. detonsa]|uniref:Uncharacterized protein n=1 Tax=Lentinula aff. detonsa TaxID=2804958 RepID=A0AA38L1Z9_9AGAR|nr:hypothetical protein GGU10DRAFT_379935 [Lentinula aff. detonsa]